MEPPQTELDAPMVFDSEKDESIRFYWDYRKLSAVTEYE